MFKIKDAEFNKEYIFYINNKSYFATFRHFMSEEDMHIIKCTIKPFLVSLYESNSYNGVSICQPEDEYNEEYGKILAFSKAANKLINSIRKYEKKRIEEERQTISYLRNKIMNARRFKYYINGIVNRKKSKINSEKE